MLSVLPRSSVAQDSDAVRRHDRAYAGLLSLLVHAALGLLVLVGRPSQGFGDGTETGGGLYVEYVAVAQADVSSMASSGRDGSLASPLLQEANDVPSPLQTEVLRTAEQVEDGSEGAIVPAMERPADFVDASSEELSAATTMNGVAGGGQGDDDLDARYRAAMRARIATVWTQLVGRPLPGDCTLEIRQEAGGSVVSAQATDCALDVASRNRLEAAALMAQPLPYAGYESVFLQDLRLDMDVGPGR